MVIQMADCAAEHSGDGITVFTYDITWLFLLMWILELLSVSLSFCWFLDIQPDRMR